MTHELDKRRRRLRYRCWHRGTKELDLLLGRFADRYLVELDSDQLGRLERLLEVPEPLLYDWITGREAPGAACEHDVMNLINNFNNET